MIFYALERPLTTTIILISGDRDYSYAISSLQNRGYPVKLLASAGCLHSNLPLIADVLDWNTVLELPARKAEVVDVGVSTINPPIEEPALKAIDPDPEKLEQPAEEWEEEEDDNPPEEPAREPMQTDETAADAELDGRSSPGWTTVRRKSTAAYDAHFPPLPSAPAGQMSSSSSLMSFPLPQSPVNDRVFSAPSISPVFEDLILVLDELRLTGYPTPLWGMVSEHLIRRDPTRTFLAKAGVT